MSGGEKMRRLSCGLLLALAASTSLGADADDPSKWTPTKIPGQQSAPEFEDITAWVNSKPLTMAGLTGKVVVVHFMTFGWINCIHNYPWYKAIAKDFKDKDVVVIGIHTPETEGEKNLDRLKKKLQESGLTHPVAVDNKTTMWNRYRNQSWPTIYLIDKKGIARWGWSGELSWKGAKGESQMRKKIEALLEE
jgi:hypothetical protein